MNSSTRISPVVADLRFFINVACLTDSCGRQIHFFRLTPAAIQLKNQPPPFVDADRVESAPPYRKQLPYARRARQQPGLTTHTQTHIRVFLVPMAAAGRVTTSPPFLELSLK
jgi:hypothetical protein